MKTKIVAISEVEVEVTMISEVTGEPVTTTYSAPAGGGYVRDEEGAQVCARLSPTGETLYWSGRAPLVKLIRREYAAMRRAEKKWAY